MLFVSFSLFSVLSFLFGATPDSLLHQFIKCCPNRKISLLKNTNNHKCKPCAFIAGCKIRMKRAGYIGIVTRPVAI